MSYIIKHAEDTSIPEWLSEHLSSECPICSAPMLNYHNDVGRCTRRFCSNKSCPGTVSAKIAKMCSITGLAGFKEGKAMQLVREKKLTSHWQALQHIYTSKVTMPVDKYLSCCFIYGVDSKLKEVANNISSEEDLRNAYSGKYSSILYEYKDVIEEGIDYVNLSYAKNEFKYDAIVKGTVNITGNITGYKDREDFVKGINSLFEGLVRISYSPSARKTGLMATITEHPETTTTKIARAKEGGIPIMSPQEFQDKILTDLSNTEVGLEFLVQLFGNIKEGEVS